MEKSEIIEILKKVKFPGYTRDIVSFGLVREALFNDGKVWVSIKVTTNNPEVPRQIQAEAEAILRAHPQIKDVRVDVEAALPSSQNQAKGVPSALRHVKYVVAVASGKGGVGKSTVAVNLACAFVRLLAAAGRPAPAVGLLDADIYGPSIPLMMGAGGQPLMAGDKIAPVLAHGVKLMSLGFLTDENTPVLWRGAMVNKAIQQFLTEVDWGFLEVLVVDLPPGTGDAQLTLAQTIPLSGAVVVTTPQKAAASVAKRGALMFGKVNTPLLGVLENMSYLELPQGGRDAIFGEGGGALTAAGLQTDFLGQIPLSAQLRECGDAGTPLVLKYPESAAAKVFMQAAEKILLDLPRLQRASTAPETPAPKAEK